MEVHGGMEVNGKEIRSMVNCKTARHVPFLQEENKYLSLNKEFLEQIDDFS